MVRRIDNLSEQSEYLNFRDEGKPNPKATTRIYSVRSRTNGTLLGVVKWFATWRKYTFAPNPNMIFDSKCLTDIGEYCKLKTEEHRTGSSAGLNQRAVVEVVEAALATVPPK